MKNTQLKEALNNWGKIVKKYQKPNPKKAVIQILNSYLPFVGLWILMYYSLNWSYFITLALGMVNAFFLVRIFIIQHDCGHYSFLKSKKVNDIIGFISSFFSTIPYKYWSQSHAAHHAHNGQLEHRGLGDIHYLTKREYLELSGWGKFKYRVFRSMLVQFVISPIVYLTINLRYPFNRLKDWKKTRIEYFLNNILVGLVYVTLALLLGWQKFLMVHLPVLMFFGIIAFWFFYVQHQQEENYKAWKDDWDHVSASILGSTYYKLPKLFQWLTGNIGFHHIHHLNSRIPNYHLEACTLDTPELTKFVPVLTFWKSLQCIKQKLWDEERGKMISFKELG